MKKLLLASITLFSLSCYAQDQQKLIAHQPPIAQTFMGYVIKINSNNDSRYSYDILYMGKMILSQKLNPFNLSPKGLSTKEDAMKIAQWQIKQLAAGTPGAILSNQPVSAAVAHELNITID